jgi:hypothetical protein
MSTKLFVATSRSFGSWTNRGEEREFRSQESEFKSGAPIAKTSDLSPAFSCRRLRHLTCPPFFRFLSPVFPLAPFFRFAKCLNEQARAEIKRQAGSPSYIALGSIERRVPEGRCDCSLARSAWKSVP